MWGIVGDIVAKVAMSFLKAYLARKDLKDAVANEISAKAFEMAYDAARRRDTINIRLRNEDFLILSGEDPNA